MKMRNIVGFPMRNFIERTVHPMIKSRRLRWTGNVARMEEGRSAFKILTGKPTDIDERTILEWNLKY